MKIGTKVISLLALLFAVLIALEIVIQKQVLMPSFAALEHDDARTSMKRIDYALNMVLEGLETTARDWGNWADVYQFVQKPTSEFVKANINFVALKQLQINALMIVDLQGAVVLADARDLESGESLNIDLSAAGSLPDNFPWRRHLTDGRSARGLIRTNHGIMMLASAPVLDGSGTGRSLGAVIMGKLLTAAEVRRIGAEAQTDLAMLQADVSGGGERIVETATTTEVYRAFPDIYGAPLMSLRVDVPRQITERGQRAVTYASAYLIGVGLAALVLLVIVLNRVVLGPLARVTRHAVAIGDGADLSARLNLHGDDEVAVLAREFDRMVESVEESRRQLVDQSFQSGFAELAKGVLHNLGNAMTPLGVRLSKLAERLRDAPVADLELALTESCGTGMPIRRGIRTSKSSCASVRANWAAW